MDQIRLYPHLDNFDDDLERFSTAAINRNRFVYRLIPPVSIFRAFLEFVLPIGVGSYVAFLVFLSA